MFRILAAAAALFACAAANAHQLTVSRSDTVRLGTKVISRGDKRARVIDTGGEPVYVRRLDFGERMVYRNGPNGHIVIDLDMDGVVVQAVSVIGPVNAKRAKP